jgi:hypothetical protein
MYIYIYAIASRKEGYGENFKPKIFGWQITKASQLQWSKEMKMPVGTYIV